MISGLRVLFLAAEAAPLVKVGGLADVAGSLPRALQALPTEITGAQGIDVRVVLPFHGAIDRTNLNFRPVAAFTISHTSGPIPGQVFETKVNGFTVYLVSGPPIMPEAPIYTSDAGVDGLKYTFFSLAALEFARATNWSPHILHAHDWHTSPAVYALSLNRNHSSFFAHTATLLTVHNLPYLGVGAQSALQEYGLPPDYKELLPEWARQMPLPLGLLSADHINAVSETYAEEIMTPEFGSGLDGFLRTRRDSISGILNGLDMQSWDPQTDKAIPVNFSGDTLVERKENKMRLQAELKMGPNPRIPLLAMITRMDQQKGVDLAVEGLRQIAHLPWRAVILGTGDPALERMAHDLAAEHPTKVHVITRFDANLARRIYAGADMIMVPSRYEPCGLTQMIGMRYGCVPVVRAVGGLKDTVSEYGDGEGTGFLFTDANPAAFAGAVSRALDVYSDQRRWRGLQLRGMQQDFSWKQSAVKYFELYQQLATDRVGV